MRPGLWAAVTVAGTLALGSDVHRDRCLTTTATNFPRTPADLRALANSCSEVSARTHSAAAAVTASAAFINLGELGSARDVLKPFTEAEDANVLYLLAYLDNRQGLSERALERFRRSAEISRPWASQDLYVNSASELARELLEANRFEEAIRVLDPVRRRPFEQSRYARIYAVRALLELGDVTAAEAEFTRLQTLRLGLSPVLLELLAEGQLRLAEGQLQSADQLLRTYLTQAAALPGRRHHEGWARIYLADVALASRAWEGARALLAEARSGPHDAATARDLAYRDGIAAREAGRLDESLALFQKTLFEDPDPATDWRILTELGQTLEELGRRTDARTAYQRSISEIEALRSTLHDLGLRSWLSESRRRPYLALFELNARSGSQRQALEALERFLGGTISADVAAGSESVAREPLQALERAEAVRDVVAAETRLGGEQARLRLGPAPFVAFVEGRRNLWRILHGSSGTAIEPLDAEARDVCARARRLSENPDDESVAAELGSALFGPELPSSLGRRFAIVVPRCALNLPFAAVRVGGRRLVELAVVSAAPDLTTGSGGRPAGADRSATLVLGDPRNDLPAARAEAEGVAHGLGVDALVGPAASSAALLQAPLLRLLHLATHATVGAGGPALVLSDRLLAVSDILNARLAPALVVLASCRSGSIAEESARETLASAFLRSGSGHVLATVRSVEDTVAARMVQAFYAAGGLEDPPGALARAQRALARSEPPSRWAVFFIAGAAEARRPRLAASRTH